MSWASGEELRKSKERSRKIIDYSNDAIFVIDPSRDEILDVNPRACTMLAYTREELLNLSISTIHPSEMSELTEFSNLVLRQGNGWTNELTCLTKTGKVLPSEISASAIDLEGKPCLIVLARDITERKLAEEMRSENERTRMLIETAGAAARRTISR